MQDQKEGPGFTVRDLRTAAPESESEAKQEAVKKGPESTQGTPSDASPRAEQQEAGPLPEPDFSSFIFSLAATAQMGLGLIPDPHTKLTAQNLPAAKQMIDLLGMLKDKTKGNLAEQEQTLLENILTSLRLQYVSAAAGKK